MIYFLRIQNCFMFSLICLLFVLHVSFPYRVIQENQDYQETMGRRERRWLLFVTVVPLWSLVLVLLSFRISLLYVIISVLCSHILKYYLLFQGFRGLPGRIGSPGLDGEKVRPHQHLIKPKQSYPTMLSAEILSLLQIILSMQHGVFAKQGDTGFAGTPGTPGLNGLTGRKVNIQVCTSFSFPVHQTYANSLFSTLQGDKGEGGINGVDGDPGVKGVKVSILTSVDHHSYILLNTRDKLQNAFSYM